MNFVYDKDYAHIRQATRQVFECGNSRSAQPHIETPVRAIQSKLRRAAASQLGWSRRRGARVGRWQATERRGWYYADVSPTPARRSSVLPLYLLFFVGAASAMVVRRRSVRADRSRHAPVQCINIVCGRRRPILRYWRLAVAADIWNSLHAALRMRTCRDTSKFGTHYPWTLSVLGVGSPERSSSGSVPGISSRFILGYTKAPRRTDSDHAESSRQPIFVFTVRLHEPTASCC